MITITGESIWPADSAEGDPSQAPSLKSIAVGLARTVRFAGQTSRFYTVLAHTFTVADLLPPDLKVYGLLHDAPEAIVGDVTSTWKTADHKAAEDDLLGRISRACGLDWPWPHDVWAPVKVADETCLAAEAHALGHAQAEKWWPLAEWQSGDDQFVEAMRLTKLRWADALHWVRSPYAVAGEYVNLVRLALRVAR
jgi:hypothetical protein